MRWATLAVVFFSLVCSAFSTDSAKEPSLRIMAKTSVYNVGEKKGIYCEGANLREAIEWLSPSGEVVEGRSAKNTRVFVERKSTEPNVAALIIQSTKIKDSGNWTCKTGERTETIEVIVGEKVLMDPDFEEMQEDEGKTIKLKCLAKGNPTPVVQWYKEGVPIPSEIKYKMSDRDDEYTLEIKRLTHADAGEYMCKVTQKALSHYTHKIIKLTVHHKPIPFNPQTKEIYAIAAGAKYRTEEVFAVLNETKEITCSALAIPPPKFKWFKRKHNFDEPIRAEESIVTSEDFMSSTLKLGIYEDSDLGQYKCTAQNDKGSVSTIFHVSLGVKPNPPENFTLASANTTYLVFNVTCGECTFIEDENTRLDPNNLPITGYYFELAEHVEGYPADWESNTNFTVDIEDPENTLFEVGPLPNKTTFYVRLRSINPAGFSDWLEFSSSELPQTSNVARFTTTLFLMIVALFITLCY